MDTDTTAKLLNDLFLQLDIGDLMQEVRFCHCDLLFYRDVVNDTIPEWNYDGFVFVSFMMFKIWSMFTIMLLEQNKDVALNVGFGVIIDM